MPRIAVPAAPPRGRRSRQNDAKLALLASVPWFAGCPHSELVATGRELDMVVVGPGTILEEQGGRRHWCTLLADGSALSLHDGIPTALLGPGTWLGAPPRPGPCPRTVVVLEPALLLTADRRRWWALAERYPALAQVPEEVPPRKNRSKSPSTPAPCSVIPPSTTTV